jgi:hypothetical protein
VAKSYISALEKETCDLSLCAQHPLVKNAVELSQFTLSHLSKNAILEVKTLLSRLGKMVKKYDLRASDIDFLLQATPDARCSMAPKWVPDEVERLLKCQDCRDMLLRAADGFFPKDFEKTISLHVANIESITTAMGYSAISPALPELGPPWVKKGKEASASLRRFIQDMAGGPYLVPSIGSSEGWHRAFSKRYSEFVKLSDDQHRDFVDIVDPSQEDRPVDAIYMPTCKQFPLLECSVDEKEGLEPSCFTGQSFVMQALKLGVNMRSHVSGSAPLTLAGMKFLDSVDGVEASEEQIFMRGGLIISCYQLGDYHSLAETAAGVCHFHQMQSIIKESNPIYTNDSVQSLEELSPVVYLSLAIGHMLKTVKDESVDVFSLISNKVLEYVSSRVSCLAKRSCI